MRENPLLTVQNVSRTYKMPRKGLFSSRPLLKAVSNVSLALQPGKTLGIVGESGSGKSTLARMIMGFELPDTGKISFSGEDINTIPTERLVALRPSFQMVFQDPFSSLDPRKTVGWSISEPLLQNRALSGDERKRLVDEALGNVGLRPRDASRYPHEFSGGQRQRIAIARAIVTRPKLIIADEPVSALDVSIQAQILNLLMDMHEALDLSMLIISHDLAVIANICDDVIVMRQGEVVESGAVEQILGNPDHPYTQELLALSSAE